MPQIIKQKKFETIDNFMKGSNNFRAHFLKGNPWGETRRANPHFKRFQQQHSELEKQTTDAMVAADQNHGDLPYDLLYESYQKMSELVFDTDEGARSYSKPDEYLTA